MVGSQIGCFCGKLLGYKSYGIFPVECIIYYRENKYINGSGTEKTEQLLDLNNNFLAHLGNSDRFIALQMQFFLYVCRDAKNSAACAST